MLFNSLAYLIFLPTVFLLYWGLPARFRCTIVVAASFLFYGWWDVRFLGLMTLVCACNWLAGIGLESVRHRRRLCTGVVLFNFSILGVFKYHDFFAQSLETALTTMGWDVHFPLLQFVLPVGISFYTFQATGYVVDVYRRHTPAERDALRFFAFISFFPQLVAGPIERSSRLLPQFATPRRFDRPQATDGMRLILWGLMKKMLVADNCAVVADHVFANSATASAGDLWWGAVCFAFQIYGDFSGYSDMAVGSAKLFGIELMRNFERPYLSHDIPEFWRRWHISLMSWFRDYVYIPLGGNRWGKLRKWRNTLTVFLLSGIWHGAGWTFVAWGLYHALLFVPASLFRKTSGQRERRHPGQVAVTFMLVVIGWVIFRSADMAQAVGYVAGMFDLSRGIGLSCSRLPVLYIAALMLAEYGCRGRHPLDFRGHGLLRFRATRFAVYYILFLFTLWAGGKPAAFIYFQF